MVSLCGQGSENYLVESVLSYYLHMSSVGHSDCQACVAQPAETTCCPDKNFTILLFVSFFFFPPLNPGPCPCLSKRLLLECLLLDHLFTWMKC